MKEVTQMRSELVFSATANVSKSVFAGPRSLKSDAPVAQAPYSSGGHHQRRTAALRPDASSR
jgi:hypothetical protein